LDALFTELQDTQKPATAAGKPAAATAANSPTAGSPEKTDAAPEGEERAAMLKAAGFDADAPAGDSASLESESQNPTGTEDERSALLAAAGFETPESGAAADGANAPVADSVQFIEDSPVPYYLKPLEWISAPLEHCSPMVRQALGQVAIVTCLMSVAVLTYVFIFRKH
jgi:hypothetical protein